MAAITGCQKEITGDIINTGTTGGTRVDSTKNQTGSYIYYYQANIDGVDYKEVVTENNGYIAGSAASGTDDVIVGAGINLMDSTKKGSQLGVSKGTIHNYLQLSNAGFKAFFSPASYPYSKNAINGVSIGWADKNGSKWSTSLGSADQTGSSFKVISTKDGPGSNGYFIDVTIEFNCMLYNESGNKKTLTNGKAVVVFGKI